MFREIIKNVKDMAPIVHNITNPVTSNDCANILLSCGASPVMADDPIEAEEITAGSDSLVINLGMLNERKLLSMFSAGKKANELSHPVILDPVGAGASRFRTDTALRLLEKVSFSVIRGNASEIRTLCLGNGHMKGVDADAADRVTEDNLAQAITMAVQLSKCTGAVIVISGEIDIAADGSKAYVIHNGHPMMSKITGSGCMLSSVIGAFCAANPHMLLKAAATAVCAFGICGEQAYDKVEKNGEGTASFRIHFIDCMSRITPELLSQRARIEVINSNDALNND